MMSAETTCLAFPAFTDLGAAEVFLARWAHMLRSFPEDRHHLVLWVDPALKTLLDAPPAIPPAFDSSLCEPLAAAWDRIHVLSMDTGPALPEGIPWAGPLLIHDKSAARRALASDQTARMIAHGRALTDLDAADNPDACDGWFDLFARLSSAMSGRYQAAWARFQRLLRELSPPTTRAEILVLGGGPSLALAPQAAMGADLVIACNNILFDPGMMEAVRPKVVACVDAVWHAGPSRYAQAHRDALIAYLKAASDHWVVTRLVHEGAFRALCPPGVGDRVIGLPVSPLHPPTLDLRTRFAGWDSQNVLTMVLLPLAASLGGAIRLLGFDGQAPQSCANLWDYAITADKPFKPFAKMAHPAFVTRDEVAYRARHEANLAHLLALADQIGLDIKTLAPSHIAPLAGRYPTAD